MALSRLHLSEIVVMLESKMESSTIKWPEKGQIRSHSMALCKMASDSMVLLLAGKLKANKRRQELGICLPQDVVDAESFRGSKSILWQKNAAGVCEMKAALPG